MRGLRHLSLLLCALLSACATVTNPVTGEPERTVMDESQEIAQGQKAHQQVMAEYRRYPDDAVQTYVNELGQRLAAQSHRSQLDWHFTVVDSPEVNAFALPGGYIYVTRGLMAYMDSEADLAGVIGHEMGHYIVNNMYQEYRMGIRTVSILAIEDNPTDVMLMREALANAKLHIDLQVVHDGVAGLEFLRRLGTHAQAPRPDLVLLDLNLPRKSGLEVLAEIKSDESLRAIPVVMLTTSQAEDDLARAYAAHVNCYIRKPVDFERFAEVVKNIEDFWFTVVTLPK